MLVYNSLIDFMLELEPGLRWNDVKLGFPITKSFVACATALFLVGPLSSSADEILIDFPDLDMEDHVHILQRIMAAMSITSRLSIQSCCFKRSLGKNRHSACYP